MNKRIKLIVIESESHQPVSGRVILPPALVTEAQTVRSESTFGGNATDAAELLQEAPYADPLPLDTTKVEN